MENTPAQITDVVLEFCRSIRADHQPEYISVNTIPGDEARDCYGNVAKRIETSGEGSIQYGWAIWLDPHFLIEAEHHAVWVEPDGHKECVSKQTNTDKILFLPDPENVAINGFIPNRRKALTNDPRMQRWLSLAEENDRLRAKNIVFNADGTMKGHFINEEMVKVQFAMMQLQVEMGMVPSEADMMEGMRGVSLETEQKPRANLTPAQRAEMFGIDDIAPRKKWDLTPKERAEERKKHRRRAKRRNK